MSTRLKLVWLGSLIVTLCLLGYIWRDIRNTYIELGHIKTELAQLKQQFNQYQTLVQKVNDIDNKFTQELTYAKAENTKLYNNVINGLGRLQLNIAAPAKTATSGVVDAKACELTGEARQNYYLLRDDILTKDSMIAGLQHYITSICLAD